MVGDVIQGSPELVVRRIRGADRTRALELLAELSPSIAGSSSRCVYSAWVRDSISRDDLISLWAFSGSTPVGFVFAIMAHKDFWRKFALRHPLAALVVMGTRVRRARGSFRPAHHAGQLEPAIDALMLPVKPGLSWSDRAPHIAKIVFVGAASAARGRGVASRLYHELFCAVAPLGIRRIDARIELHNTASIRLHHRTGWHMSRDDHGVFCTIEIPRPQDDR